MKKQIRAAFLQAGVLWQLVPHLFHFDYTLEEGGEWLDPLTFRNPIKVSPSLLFSEWIKMMIKFYRHFVQACLTRRSLTSRRSRTISRGAAARRWPAWLVGDEIFVVISRILGYDPRWNGVPSLI